MTGKTTASGAEEADLLRLTEVAGVLKALAHPSRLLILEALAREPHCVCELTRMIGADTSTVSKHLSVMKNAGVLLDEKRGNMVYYSLACPCVTEAVAHITPLLERRFRHYGDILKRKGPPRRRVPGTETPSPGAD